MDRFSFRLLQDARFGPHEVESLPELLHQADARHVFLVSDRGLEAAGLVDMVRSIIVRAGYDCTCFLDVEPDPTAKTIEACAAHYRDCGADVTVALGGGSSIDAAKAMRAVARYGGHALDYEGTGKIPGPLDPLIAIPTTAGTGSEFTMAPSSATMNGSIRPSSPIPIWRPASSSSIPLCSRACPPLWPPPAVPTPGSMPWKRMSAGRPPRGPMRWPRKRWR